MSYSVGKLLISGRHCSLNKPARYLSKTIESLYFDVANIKRYTVFDSANIGKLKFNLHMYFSSHYTGSMC